MRVTDIESIILQHDMDEELGFAQGYYRQRTAHLVKVHTNEGLTGIGEIFGAGNFAFANQAIVNHVIKPLVVGKNPLDINVNCFLDAAWIFCNRRWRQRAASASS